MQDKRYGDVRAATNDFALNNIEQDKELFGDNFGYYKNVVIDIVNTGRDINVDKQGLPLFRSNDSEITDSKTNSVDQQQENEGEDEGEQE